MSVYAEPHSYDLCPQHADTVSPPRGWEVLRLDYPSTPSEPVDDMLALADAVQRSADSRRAAHQAEAGAGHRQDPDAGHESGRGPGYESSSESSSEPGSTGSRTPGTLPTRESRGRIEPPTPEAALIRGHLRMLRD